MHGIKVKTLTVCSHIKKLVMLSLFGRVRGEKGDTKQVVEILE
jgi:hypothetical protein